MPATARKTVCALVAFLCPLLLGLPAQAVPLILPPALSASLAADLSLAAAPAPAPIAPVDVTADVRAALPPLPATPRVALLRGRIETAGASDAPKVMRGGKRYECVTFARMLTGFDLYGDAKTWWAKAKGLYDEFAQPSPGAVMVFAGTGRLRHGHVAVVKEVVSSREVRVDHANWGNDGRIYLNTPVIDVSPNNDWSLVKVWNEKIHALGSHVYPLKGFLAD